MGDVELGPDLQQNGQEAADHDADAQKPKHSPPRAGAVVDGFGARLGACAHGSTRSCSTDDDILSLVSLHLGYTAR